MCAAAAIERSRALAAVLRRRRRRSAGGPPLAVSRPFGCDTTTGRCHTPASGCAKIDCGKTTACGATCSTSGCCTSSTYDRSTGLAVSGSRACCDEGDELTGTTDCGTGINHGVNKRAGTPCATAHCRKRVCPG